MDERLVRAQRGVVREELGREVVGAVHHDVRGADEREGVARVEAEVARVHRAGGEERAQAGRRGARLALPEDRPP